MAKRILSVLLLMVIIVSIMPTTAFAGWDDGTECEFCGGYRFDDWLCDDGPHCSENADSDDCYLENHCASCLGPVENSERCDICYVCPDCMNDGNGPAHCALCDACDEGGYDVCDDCDLCMNCQVEAGTHCFDCGDCLGTASQCSDHPFEMYQENHCEGCGLYCSGCGDKCFLEELFIDIYCEEHDMCVVCATDDGLHCKECYGCYEDELCSECQKCDECGLDAGDHCPECDEHGTDWCEVGGEGTHCVECASEYVCEQCELCTLCSGIEFCGECGLCAECCRENAESENCSCGEYCINSADWEDHFCMECGGCFDDTEQCDICGYCVECCEAQTECTDGMCIEDPEYDEHFCEDCQACFHTVEVCASCYDAGYNLCEDCCAVQTEDQGCTHECCVNSWLWDEHFCDICGKCYDSCEHDAEAHIHSYDVNGNCTVCGYNRDGKPVIIKQPESVIANAEDSAAVYTVEAMGDNLTYQWYYLSLSTDQPVAMTDGISYKGTTTNKVSLTVLEGMCSLGKPVKIFCAVNNQNGTVTTDTVEFTVAHQYGNYEKNATHHWYACANCDKIKDKTEHEFDSWTIVKQADKNESGLKRRTCYDCGYIHSEILPALPADHVHDYSEAYVMTDAFHWTKCACGNENKGVMEEHDFGAGWVITVQPTIASVGEETRTCTVCGYTQTREVEKQGHTHEFYNEEYLENHKDNGNYGYLIHNGYIVNLYSEPYGKTDRTYHYAYCVVEGCDAYEKYTHKWYTEWYDLPTENLDGSYEKICEECYYHTGLKTSPAGSYRVVTKNCTTNMQAAKSGSTVKITLYKDYPAGYFVNFNESYPSIDVNYTWGNGASGTWEMIEEEYHSPDEKNPKGYWTFTMPELPEGSDWLNFYVEVEVELIDCRAENHGDGRGLEWTDIKEPTCGQPGYTGNYKCKWCNYIEERGHDIPATGEHGELVAEEDYMGDCEHSGYIGAKRCSVCNEVVVPREYNGRSHRVTKVEGSYIAPTCTSKGRTAEFACGRCGVVVTKSRTIAKLPHDWEFFKGTASCTEGGILDYVKCRSCEQISINGGETILRNPAKLNSEALGHTYDEGVVTKAATCTATGEKLLTCTVEGCGATKTETVAKLGHSYSSSYTVDKKATTSAQGSKSKHCTRCDAKTSVTAIAKVSNVKLSFTKKNYTGSAISAPTLTVKDSNGKALVKGTDYTVTGLVKRTNVGRYKVTVTFKGNYSGTKTLYYTITPKAPSSVKVRLRTVTGGYDDVVCSWTKATGASGYAVYYKKASASTYTLLGRTTGTSMTKKDLADGVKYTFKVVPYYTSNGVRYLSLGYRTASIYTLKKISTPTLSRSSGKVKVKWANINGESGYQISRSTSKTGTNIVSTYSTTSGNYKNVSATAGKTYYYKVRAYKVVNGTKVFGPWSSPRSFKR